MKIKKVHNFKRYLILDCIIILYKVLPTSILPFHKTEAFEGRRRYFS